VARPQASRAPALAVEGLLADRGEIAQLLGPELLGGDEQAQRDRQVTIVDRPGLEATACECCRAVKEEFARSFG
jgi:hypothetical protein